MTLEEQTRIQQLEVELAGLKSKQSKKIDIGIGAVLTDKWEGARFRNGKIERAFVTADLKELVNTALGRFTTGGQYPVGCRLNLVFVLEYPEPEDPSGLPSDPTQVEKE